MNVLSFKKKKAMKDKITMVTAYDYTAAQILDQTDIDCILVGDSAAMTMHGHDTTIPATLEMMVTHVAAVARGAKKFIVADLPFLSYRSDLSETIASVKSLMQAGAHAVKLEGADGNFKQIEHLVTSGVPVMGHIGMTPQSFHQMGGFRVQGKDEVRADSLLYEAKALQESGCFALVLECMPSELGKSITEALDIPTIGIGAGSDTSGQVLVFQDLLGLGQGAHPKFVKQYLNGSDLMKIALNTFHEEVQQGVYPNEDLHGYDS